MITSIFELRSLALLLSLLATGVAADQPNFILILTDDHGWTSTSSLMDRDNPLSGSDYIETPHIDALVRSGMRFSQGYATAALCTPTRRSLLFGQTQLRQGPDEDFDKRYDPYERDYLTIPLMLKAVDPSYRTAHFGKWHLKSGDFSPEDFGYDQSDGRTGNGDGNIHEYKEDKWKNVFFSDDPKRTDRISGRGVSFIRRNVAAGNPFFLQLSYYASHVDIQATEETYDRFTDKPRGRVHDHPGFAAMLHDLDEGIGQILEQVERSGIADNTYIIFLADNGGVELIPQTRFKLAPPDFDGRPRLNHPLRGGKWVLYEGGIRVPFALKGPGIPAAAQCDTPVVAYDLLPTIAELAGYQEELPAYIDGGSIVPLLDDAQGDVDRPQPAIFHHRDVKSYPHSAVRQGDFKLIKFWTANYAGEARVELYNLAEDIGEVNDLSAEMPMKAKEMEALLLDYLEEIGAPVPGS